MASAVEVEALRVRLLGDGSDDHGMITQAVQHTQAAGHQIEQAAHQIEHHAGSLTRFAHAALGALEVLGAVEFFREAFGAFGKLEVANLKLTAAIEANGSAVEATMAKYKTFIAEMAEHTLVTKG